MGCVIHNRESGLARLIQIIFFLFFSVLAGCETVSEEINKFSLGDIVEVDDGKCLILTAESEAHPVGVCDYKDRYSFHVGSRKMVYSKPQYEFALRERLSSFVQSKGYPRGSLGRAKIEVWMNAPVHEPFKAHLTVVVLNDAGNFAVNLPVNPNKWMINKKDVILLPKEGYPTVHAKKAGYLLVAARDHVSKRRFKEFLEEAGVENPPDAHLAALETDVFAETDLATQIRKHPDSRYIVRKLDFLPASDQDGTRGLGFTIDFFR